MAMVIDTPTLTTDKSSNEVKSNRMRIINDYWKRIVKDFQTIFTFHPQEWRNAFRSNPNYRLFVKGDIDGLITFFVDTLATLLTIILGLQPILGNRIIYGKIMPGVGLSMLWSSSYYFYMARKLAFKEQRGDICAMPSGVSVPGAFAFIYTIIMPTFYQCMETNETEYCQDLAWRVGLANNFMTGLILLVFSIFAEFIRKHVPAVALLSSLSGVGLVYLALGAFVGMCEIPLVSFLPFAIVILGFFGQVKFGCIPFAVIALTCGIILGWATSTNDPTKVYEASMLIRFYAPEFSARAILTHFGTVRNFLSTTVPTGISIAIATIQCVESAKRAGDFYPTREAIFADGIGTLIASLFGSIFSMNTYIGHPALKKMGAKQSFSLIHGLLYVPLSFFGISAVIASSIGIGAMKPILVCVGLLICADTFSITPQRHFPALLLGLMSIVAAWVRGTILNGVNNAYGPFTISNTDFSNNITARISSFSYQGLVNFSGGSQLLCIFIIAIMIYMTDRKFLRATFWSFIASVSSFFGLIHADQVGVLVTKEDDGWRFAISYIILCLLFIVMELSQRKQWIEKPETEPDDLSSPEWLEWKQKQLETSSTGIENIAMSA